MAFYLFLLVMLLPIVEIWILVQIGHATSVWVPFAIVICSMIAGVVVARWQGLRVAQRVREDARAGRMPADAMVDGFLILLAGILLIIPGVLTDVVGIALLIPPLRNLMKRGAKAWIQRNVQIRVAGVSPNFGQPATGAAPTGNDQIIDARVINTRVEDIGRST